MTEHTFSYEHDFLLESGEVLPGFQLQYTTAGQVDESASNVVWVCHALTANADVFDWWPGLFGTSKLYDPADHFIVCANMLGSCYGSTGPLSVDPRTDAPFYYEFPLLTNRDIVRAFDLLRQHLRITRIHTLIGGSMGGQQALEWAIMQPVADHLIQLASNAQHSPWGIAFNESQRMAIEQDASWGERSPRAGLNGLRVARSVALLSYRHYRTYARTQHETTSDTVDKFRASSYQNYQGEKLARRFNAFSYWTLSKAMDSHHIGRKRGSIAEVLRDMSIHCLFISLDTDVLFPRSEQENLAQQVPGAQLAIIDSDYGHDGFLIETAALSLSIQSFYAKTS